MQVRATNRHARMSPRKMRPLASALRGLSATAAEQQLMFIPGKAAETIRRVLASAVANATNNFDLPSGSLRVASVQIDEGLKMRRFQPASRGMAHPIIKRTSHVTVVVEGKEVGSKKKKKKTEIETVSVDTYAAELGKEEPLEEEVGDVVKKEQAQTEGRPDKQIDEGFQKTKMMQQGGDKKKTHRRKSA